jgi:AraC family transcriptional regulator
MKEDYIKRVNRILVFIDQNLDNDLSLEKISSIGFYSPFHLHRIFRDLIGETLNAYITRKRIEKTAAMLMHRKEITISEISMLYGFNSNSSFTRTFKKFYGVSPSAFRELSPSQYSKISKTESKNGQVLQLFEEYICNINNLKNWMKMNAKIEIKELPQMDFAYITQIGVDGLDDAFGRVIKWAATKRLLDNPNCKVARIYHDSFKITAPDKVRMSVGIILDEKVELSGEIALMTIKAGKFIIGHFEIEPKDFEKSWSSLYVWMNENGYQKADPNPLEVIHNNFNEHPEKKCIVDLYISIV